MKFSDFLVQRGAPADWRQAGADFATAVLDGKHDIAEAVRSIKPVKLSLTRHGTDGRIEATEFLDVTERDVADFNVGIAYGIGWRDAVRTGATAAERAVPAGRVIGFHR